MADPVHLELYHNAMSSCAQKVRLVLAEKALDYVSHHLDLRAGESHTPAYLALNPKGVVPTLITDGQPVIESTIICEYLDEAFATPSLRPADALACAAMRQWTIQPDAGLHAAIGTLSFAVAFRFQNAAKQNAAREEGEISRHLRDIADNGLDAEAFRQRVPVLQKMLGQMAQRLNGHMWLTGDSLSLADIAMLPYVCRIRDLGQDWLWEDDARFAAIKPWLARMVARPSYAQAMTTWYDTRYLALMAEKGDAARTVLRKLFAPE